MPFPRISIRREGIETVLFSSSNLIRLYKKIPRPRIPRFHPLRSLTFVFQNTFFFEMFQLVKSLSIVVLAAVTAVQAYSNPGACSGACWAHDPALIRRGSDGKYFKFNTGAGIEIATASSLSGPWTLQGYALPDGSSISNAGSDDLWVCLQLVDGLYLLTTLFRPQMLPTLTVSIICTTRFPPSEPKSVRLVS